MNGRFAVFFSPETVFPIWRGYAVMRRIYAIPYSFAKRRLLLSRQTAAVSAAVCLKTILTKSVPPRARPTPFHGVGRLGGGEWEAAKRENACVTVYSGKTVFRHDITPTYCAISIPTRRSAASKRRLRRCGYVRGGGRLLCFSFLMICNSVPFDLERCDM